MFAHCQDHFIQRQVRLSIRSNRKSACLAARRPVSRKHLAQIIAGTDLNLLGALTPRSSAFHFRNHALTHVRRIGLRPRQPPKSESMSIDSPILSPMRIPLIQLGRYML